MSSILKFSSLKISLETLERSFSREEKIEISREASWDIEIPPLGGNIINKTWLSDHVYLHSQQTIERQTYS